MTNNYTLFESYPDILSVVELSNLLNISTKTAYKLLKSKAIYSIRIGKNYKIPKTAVLDFIGTAS